MEFIDRVSLVELSRMALEPYGTWDNLVVANSSNDQAFRGDRKSVV